ncbi:MAG: NfeD family protein [Nitrospira sp.]|nr:NfeD family protein [Nitrospira sp.]MBH0183688.1 NfeD family protein [Nitrospira sp.]
MIWWYWIFLGLALAGAEMLSPGGFYLLFFGIASIIVGALAGMDVVTAAWLQWLLFSGLAVLALLLLRGPLLRMTHSRPAQEMDSMVGEAAVLMENLQPGHTGKAELRGSTWTVRNVGTVPLSSGQRATVTKVDGLTIFVTPE